MKRWLVIIIFLACSFLIAQSDRFPSKIEDFSGGIDLTSPVIGMDQRYFLTMENFLINGKHLEVRPGLSNYLRTKSFSPLPLTFMDFFNKGLMHRIIVSDGERLWVADDSSALDNYLNPYAYGEGTVDGTSGDSVLHASSPSTVAWLAFFGYGAGDSIMLADDTFEISHIMLDTVLFINGTLTHDYDDSSYSILTDFGTIYSGVNWEPDYYLSSARGLFLYNGNNLSTLDSAYEPWRYRTDEIGTYDFGRMIIFDPQDVGCGSCTTWADGQFNEWYAMLSSHPISQNGPGGLRNTYFKLQMPIWYSAACTLCVEWVYSEALVPYYNTYVTLSKRENIENATTFSNVVDSTFGILRFHETDSGCITAFAIDTTTPTDEYYDSSSFESGDWVIALSHAPDYEYNICGGIPPKIITFGSHTYECYPVIGWVGCGVENDTSMIYYDINFSLYQRTESGNDLEGGYKYMAKHHNRLFYVKVAKPNNLYWSDAGFPETTQSLSVMTISTADGDEITGMAPSQDRLIVYKSTNIISIYPDPIPLSNRPSYAFEILSNAQGLIAPKTLVNVSGSHFGLGKNGFWGPEYKIISGAIDRWLDDSLDLNYIEDACAEYYDGNIWLSLPTKATPGKKRTFTYNLASQAWTQQSFGTAAMKANRLANDSIGLFIADEDSGKIYGLWGDTDDGDSIEATLQTSYYDFDYPENLKLSRGLMINFDAPADCNVELGIFRDTVSSAIWLDTFSAALMRGHENIYCPYDVNGQYLSLRIKIFNAADVMIPWIRWWIILGGLI